MVRNRIKRFIFDSCAENQVFKLSLIHISFEWAKYYNVLFIANHVIESRSDIKEGTEEEINQLVGEAYMLRAYVHFLLVNLYGQPYTKEGALDTKSVPLKLDTDLEKVLKRNTVEEVYTSIQADIDEARKLEMCIRDRIWAMMLSAHLCWVLRT